MTRRAAAMVRRSGGKGSPMMSAVKTVGKKLAAPLKKGTVGAVKGYLKGTNALAKKLQPMTKKISPRRSLRRPRKLK